ncbi:polysaccharide pyruvyl transferase family protein [Caulobacter sp. UC70_42]|uniref:polysaccharide pyruvyl transferase family protein n=1 Tax=Caulobacter sp. UC70_42 TaxID=3374551 RepID=UPI003756C716
MDTITLLDTSAASDNIGDSIIVEAVTDWLSELRPNAYTYTVATHEYMTGHSKRFLKASDAAYVAGTNILASNMEAGVLWKLRPWDAFEVNNAVLVGCGWLNYMKAPNAYSQWILKKVLSDKHIHAVRDSYTLAHLQGLGKRVLNTSCPTMWRLTPEHCATIPSRKADEVVTTFTFYHRDVELDRSIIEMMKANYSRVHFWPQQREDLAYFQSLGVSGVELVNPSLRAYDELLSNKNVEFLGTRLHGGIRALQKGRRALIIVVDNRAAEIGKDTGLPIVKRRDVETMKAWIQGDRPTEIALPRAAIDEWMEQFA